MAYWIENIETITRFGGDDNRGRGGYSPVSYGADNLSDIASLPTYSGQNAGSSVLVLEDGSFHKLGTIPSRGINGWVKL